LIIVHRSLYLTGSVIIGAALLCLSAHLTASPQQLHVTTNDLAALKAAAERGETPAQHDLAGCYLTPLPRLNSLSVSSKKSTSITRQQMQLLL